MEQIFNTRKEAQDAIDEFVQDTIDSPDISDYYLEDYRVVEIPAST